MLLLSYNNGDIQRAVALGKWTKCSFRRQKGITRIMNVDMILFLIMSGVYIIFGGLGNIIIFTVYRRQKEIYNQKTFIKTLAALDLFICIVIIPYTIFYELQRVQNDVICRMMEIVRHMATLTSNSVLCAIAFERYVAICHPARKLDQHAIRKIMISLTIVTVLFSAPAPAIFSVTRSKSKGTFDEYCQFTTSVIGILGTTIYQGFLMLLCLSGILITVLLYALIYRRLLKRVLRRRRSMSRPVTPSKYVVRKINEGRDHTADLANELSGTENEVVLCLVENESLMRSKKDQMQRKGAFETYSSKIVNPTPTEPENNELSSEHDCSIHTNYQKTRGNTEDHEDFSERRKPRAIKRRPNRHQAKPNVRRKTSIMLFVCSLIYVVTWTPFWLDVFNVTHSLVLRYLFFFGHASNPVVYGIVNNQVRADVIKLLKRR
ncbi:5-hydroxytryptamine receptor 2B-like [Saccostrea echinata]|uniref:5-hydroxytryptamine receptor 2B-like n=1 Tax=Saccostrea echinata TaxID=191078 RepID=UPI002A812C23|nr:5-hydroxytryptamine receptor 2B-like [Saccostrea echinata]